jgi:thioredoxin reductase
MQHDAVIVGGSFAGLAAATYLARGRRDVAVIDAGAPRNRFAAHAHGFLGFDGVAPGDILARAREQLAAYPTTSFLRGEAVAAERRHDGFAVTLDSGEVVTGEKLILAFGINDVLPDIPGLAERWGRSVIHCPYCHGYEFAGQRLGVLGMSPNSLHQALLIPEWGPTTFFLNGQPEPDATTLAGIEARGVRIERSPVVALRGEGTALSTVELADGRQARIDALYIGAPTRLNSSMAEQLGCAVDDGPLGKIVRTDAMKLTTVPDVWAVGDITRGFHNVTAAATDGVMAGTAAHRALVFPEAA